MLGSASFGLPSQGESRNRHESITERQYLNILQSMGQSAHIFDLDANIIYWNQSAEKLYGYTVQEALGHNVIELLADVQHYQCAANIIDRLRAGESWTGQFPVKSKTGEKFVVIATNKPFHDDDGTFIGIICVSTDTRNFQETRAKPFPKQFEAGPSFNGQRGIACSNLGLDPQHRPHVAIASKLSDLASKVTNKVKSKMRSGDNIMDRRGDLTSRRDSPPSIFGMFFPADSNVHSVVKHRRDYSDEESEVKPGIQKFITSKVKAWKGNEEGGSEPSRVGQPESAVKPESQLGEFNRTANLVEPRISSPPFNVNSTSSTSICATTTSTTQLDVGSDGSDYEISWEDLKIGEQIGQGCCGTVYHGLWFRSDVAIKVFSGQEYSDDLILSFKQEVSLMMRLRHPNILLFMGAITSPQRLCIVTEFLPRGSLFQLLHKSKSKLDWKRRVHMALDIARGVNYLHHCNPPIVHRDLKSSNLLVDKNWSVKVGDFGLSRLKHETFLKTKTAKGTPQWMAPEVIRAEPSNEKSDVYSFGVLLWELVTQKIPWDNLNSMQVIGAVGFMDQRLDIPKDIDPQWAAMIESCWRSDPQLRPTFEELLQKLKNLNRQCALAARSAIGNSSNQKEL